MTNQAAQNTASTDWVYGVTSQGVELRHYLPGFGKVAITVGDGWDMKGRAAQVGPTTYIRVIASESRRSGAIDVAFTGGLEKGCSLLFREGSEIVNMEQRDSFPMFRVPIGWRVDMPHTRTKDADNRDLVFVRPSGQFIHLQVSVLTRSGRFFLVIQTIYHGQVASTSSQKAARLDITGIEYAGNVVVGVPLSPTFAWPGANYAKNFPTAEAVLRFAAEKGASMKLSEVRPAVWAVDPFNRMEQLKEKGWKQGVVLWFNQAIGFGFVLCDDGKPAFAHFSTIVGVDGRPIVESGELPILVPGDEVALTYVDQPNGKRKAMGVRGPSYV